MQSMKERMGKVFSNTKAEVILLFNSNNVDPNFRYLSGFVGGPFEYTPLVIEKNSETLFVSELEYGLAKAAKPKEMELRLMDKSMSLKKELAAMLKGRTVGINGRFLPYRLYKYLDDLTPHPKKIIDASAALELARLIKDDKEIERIKHAAAITKRAINDTRKEMKEGMSEIQVARMFDMHMLAAGCAAAFESIIAFDSNTALQHSSPGERKLKKNTIVLFDVGARYKDYCADISRSFMFKPDQSTSKSKRFEEMHQVVLDSQSMALKLMKEGIQGKKAHSAAKSYIDEYKGGIYKNHSFNHMLGHSIGLDVHDSNMGIYPGEKNKLKSNMIFSDEPGIYIEGFGGVRIEDDVLIGKNSSSFL